MAGIGRCGAGAGGLSKRLAFVRVGSEGEPVERASASRAEGDHAGSPHRLASGTIGNDSGFPLEDYSHKDIVFVEWSEYCLRYLPRRCVEISSLKDKR